jgi:hypothetical protein
MARQPKDTKNSVGSHHGHGEGPGDDTPRASTSSPGLHPSPPPPLSVKELERMTGLKDDPPEPQATENATEELEEAPFRGNPPPPGHSYIMPAIRMRPPRPPHVNPYPSGQEPTVEELMEQKNARESEAEQFAGTVKPRTPEPGLDTVKHYLEIIPETVPNEHILFGAQHVRVTVGDLRLITGVGKKR